MARVKQFRKNRLAGVVALAFCMTVGSAPYAFALTVTPGGMPDVSVFAHAQEIPDSALSHMRGRFFDGTKIVGFGISMISKWTTSFGQTLTASALVGMKFNGNDHAPTVSFQPNLTIVGTPSGTPPSNSNVQTASGNGIQNVSGVAQGIQVAGHSNSIANNTSISVTTDNINLPTGGNGTPTKMTDSSTGSTLSASLDSSGVGVSINVPNQGQVIQRIQSGTANVGSIAPGSGLVQLVQTTGNLQQIQNTARLEIQLQSLANLVPQSNFNQTLNTLRGVSR
ncbi:MAG TPA: hypothetical protein VFW88_04710 [Burkholderiales bacterium]|nr:hypothetical protein [Burkholderiales bacterium]